MRLRPALSTRSTQNASAVRPTARELRRERREQRELATVLSTRPANVRDEVLEMASRVG